MVFSGPQAAVCAGGVAEALQQLWLHLCASLGGRSVDFTLFVSPRGYCSMVAALAPVAALGYDKEAKQCVNPLGEFP